MEYLAHLVMKEVRGKTSIPVVCTEVACQQGKKGREAISLDLSMYGDPIYLRDIRCPFSSYQKHKVERYKVGDEVSERTPVMVALPRGDLDSLPELLKIRQNFHRAIEYATTLDEVEMLAVSSSFFWRLSARSRSSLTWVRFR